MAFPVVQSYQSTATNTNSSSIVITKPTGLQEGDLMVAFIAFSHFGSSGQTINTPSGWTAIQGRNENRVVFSSYYKVANSGDVAASNFTFTFSTTVDQSSGSIHRISGFASTLIIQDSEIDSDLAPGSVNISFTGDSIPLSSESLYLIGFAYADQSTGSNFTASNFISTPTISWTEDVDVSVQEGGAGGIAHGHCVASGTLTGTAQITQYGVTLSQIPDRASIGILVIINSPQNVTADIPHLAITPTIDGLTAAVNVAPDVSHLAITPTINGVEATNSSDRTQWTNQTKPSTTWTNSDK